MKTYKILLIFAALQVIQLVLNFGSLAVKTANGNDVGMKPVIIIINILVVIGALIYLF